MHSESRNNTNILKQACKNKPNKVLIGLNIYKKKVKSDIDLNSKKYLNLPHINGLDSNLIKEEGLNKTFDGSSGININNISISKIKKRNANIINISKNDKKALL
jgi:hypothetical protein